MKQLRHPGPAIRCGVLCLGLASGLAMAEGTWVSGPSAMPVGQSGLFSTGGFAPGAIIAFRVTQPDGQSTTAEYAADGDGTAAQVLLPASEGVYMIEVLDQEGKVAATTRLAAGR